MIEEQRTRKQIQTALDCTLLLGGGIKEDKRAIIASIVDQIEGNDEAETIMT